MNFVPKTEKEIKEEMLIPEGEYDFEVLSAENKVSRQGNEMVELNLGVYVGETMKNRQKDFLLASIAYKLRHFCDATGLLREYQDGTLTADMCVGRAGKCKIIQKDSEQYGLQNSVKDYICRPTKPLQVPAATQGTGPQGGDTGGGGEENEDTPF